LGMNLLFDYDKNKKEYYAVDKDTLKEYLCTKEEYDKKKLSDKDPNGEKRWKRWS
jgi:hypothetical protein